MITPVKLTVRLPDGRELPWIPGMTEQQMIDHYSMIYPQQLRTENAKLVDISSLVRIQTYAKLYGQQKWGKPVHRQTIYEQIEQGKLTPVEIDEVKFIDTSVYKP